LKKEEEEEEKRFIRQKDLSIRPNIKIANEKKNQEI
jgi:hypothetical protein